MRKHSVVVRSLLLLIVLGAGLIAARAEEWSFVARLNRALDDIVPLDAKAEKIAGSFGFLEGPVWVRKGAYLLFSDIPANVIYKYAPDAGLVTFAPVNPSGTRRTHGFNNLSRIPAFEQRIRKFSSSSVARRNADRNGTRRWGLKDPEEWEMERNLRDSKKEQRQ